MWQLQQGGNFLQYLAQSVPPGQLASAYLSEVLSFMFDEHRHYYVFDEIEEQRAILKRSEMPVANTYGAGSRTGSSVHGRTVGQIARISLSSPLKCRCLFRLVASIKPGIVLELGTSLGISTAYLAAAYAPAKVFGLEGDRILAHHATRVADALGIRNVRCVTGPFTETLPAILTDIPTVDIAYVDGDHKREAAIRYYHVLKAHRGPASIFIIDDIRWSPGMYRAWREITQDPEVRAAIDVFSFGLVFFNREITERIAGPVIPRRWPPRVILS